VAGPVYEPVTGYDSRRWAPDPRVPTSYPLRIREVWLFKAYLSDSAAAPLSVFPANKRNAAPKTRDQANGKPPGLGPAKLWK